jgi:protein-tyrosine-phosphatase
MATALFVCRHNAGRSQMAAAMFERAAAHCRRAPPQPSTSMPKS